MLSIQIESINLYMRPQRISVNIHRSLESIARKEKNKCPKGIGMSHLGYIYLETFYEKRKK